MKEKEDIDRGKPVKRTVRGQFGYLVPGNGINIDTIIKSRPRIDGRVCIHGDSFDPFDSFEISGLRDEKKIVLLLLGWKLVKWKLWNVSNWPIIINSVLAERHKCFVFSYILQTKLKSNLESIVRFLMIYSCLRVSLYLIFNFVNL